MSLCEHCHRVEGGEGTTVRSEDHGASLCWRAMYARPVYARTNGLRESTRQDCEARRSAIDPATVKA